MTGLVTRIYRERVNLSAPHVRADSKIASRAITPGVRRVKIALNQRLLRPTVRAGSYYCELNRPGVYCSLKSHDE